MRAIWSGAINFGLVNIPVKLYSGTISNAIDFDMLDKHDNAPIRYARISTTSGKEIPYENIVKGYKYNGEDYIVITKEDFEKVNVEKTKTIDIVDFVKEVEIDSVYYEKPYFLEPDKSAAKSYALLREALLKSKKVGIALFVLRNKEHLGIIKPYGELIVLNQIRFEQELRKPDELNLPKLKEIKGKELEMALALIDQLTSKFKPENYKDIYTDELMKMIEKKAKGEIVKPQGKKRKAGEVKDLMTLLKASLKNTRKKAA